MHTEHFVHPASCIHGPFMKTSILNLMSYRLALQIMNQLQCSMRNDAKEQDKLLPLSLSFPSFGVAFTGKYFNRGGFSWRWLTLRRLKIRGDKHGLELSRRKKIIFFNELMKLFSKHKRNENFKMLQGLSWMKSLDMLKKMA